MARKRDPYQTGKAVTSIGPKPYVELLYAGRCPQCGGRMVYALGQPWCPPQACRDRQRR